MFKKAISLVVSVSLLLTQPVFAQGVAELNIGKYLSQMPAWHTDSFRPPRLRYISYDIKSNDFKLLLDQGDLEKSPGHQDTKSPEKSENALKVETQNLFNYFLIGLTLPNDKFWVNLRPDAPEQIIDPELEKTDMGRIMLAADLQLKKDTAGLTSPQNSEGREYWDKLYKKAGELFGTENITIPTITRPWIVPGEVIIRESEESAYIYKANLKVMLEEDYLTSSGGSRTAPTSDPRLKELNQYSTQLIRELILPKLTQDVNTSKKYARLRQVFFSLILARWFKDRYRSQNTENRGQRTEKANNYTSLIDSHNLDNLTSKEAWNKDYYFNEYKKSFQQGEYNLKEEITTYTGQVIRSYVSGGIEIIGESGSPLIGGAYKAIKTIFPVFLLTAVSFLSVSMQGNVTLAKTSLEIRDERAFLPIEYILTAKPIVFRIIEEEIRKKIIKKRRPDLLPDSSRINFETLEDVYQWVVEREKSCPGAIISKEIKKEINTFGEKVQLIFDTSSGEILNILNNLKYLLAGPGMRAEAEGVGFLPQKLISGFVEALSNIKEKPDGVLYWIDNAVDALSEAPGKEREKRESLKMPKASEGFETLLWKTELKLRKQRFRIREAILKSLGQGSSPIDDAAMAKEFYDTYIVTGKYKEHPLFSNANNAQDIKNLLTPIFKNQMLIKNFILDGFHDGSRAGLWEYDIINKNFIIEPDAAFASVNLKHFIIQLKNNGSGVSSAITEDLPANADSPLFPGGIDFRKIEYLTRPMGSFQGLDLRLPLLSKAELEGIDIGRELATMEQMINARIEVSTDRLKRLLAVMSQKDAFSAQRETQLLPLLLRLCWLKEERGIETTPDFRAVLLIADTGLFVEQGNTKYSLN